MTAAAQGPTLPHGYGAALDAAAGRAAVAPTPLQMPGAKCGLLTGLYRCVRKAGHGGNCTPQRRTDVDQGEDLSEIAPPASAGPVDVELVVGASTPPRWATPHGLADQLDIAAKSLRWSGAKSLTGAEQRHARAIAMSIVERVDHELSDVSSTST